MFLNSGSNWLRWDLHVHTASSYDYKYKDLDCDLKLVETWGKQNLKAVAITDHFLIDAKRIKNLRELTKQEITIFPGVELRTDKGSSNIHVILIFSEEIDLNILEQDFESIMIRDKAKPKNHTNENIYWDYSDIENFALKQNAIISIHSGSKENGLDKCMVNALAYNMAIKSEYSESVDIFEVSKIKDVSDYKKYVFNYIPERPVIICSDNHDPRTYDPKELLWIKALPTFYGLKQAIIHSSERVFIGEMPPKLISAYSNPEKYITSINICKKGEAKNNEEWFNSELNLNVGLTTVIGNKGSGKSAFADLLGYIGKSESFKSFSFLTKTRFAKEDKLFNMDYLGSIKWLDDVVTKVDSFNLDSIEKGVPLVRYLPQRYIEDTCNNLDERFQEEIDKVIFSYIDSENRGNTSNLKELIDEQQISIKEDIEQSKRIISELNLQIIKQENKRRKEYKQKISEGKKYFENELNRHEINKPKEVKIPLDNSLNIRGLDFIKQKNDEIVKFEEEISTYQKELSKENKCILDLIDFKNTIIKEKVKINEIDNNAINLNLRYEINPNISIELLINLDGLENRIEIARNKINELSVKLIQEVNYKLYNEETTPEMFESDFKNATSIYEKIHILKSRISRAKELLDRPQKNYQKYLDDVKRWNIKRNEIIGDETKLESLTYYQNEYNYLENNHPLILKNLKEKRENEIKKLFNLVLKKRDVLNKIYEPIEKKLDSILENIKDKVIFKASIYTESGFVQDTLMYINQSIQSDFKGKIEGAEYINSLIRKYDSSEVDGILGIINSILNSATYDEDKVDILLRKRLEFYNFITSLDYFKVGFSLKMGNKELEQLSPGEKGTVLLIFYLALDKEDKPLIIDQPEDNLDNQSVFNKLVPCVLEAKKNRQVILITHNPNLAVACDSELIIYSQNNGNSIRYSSGPIEDKKIKEKLVDVLEGTMPAFDLRTSKYKQSLFLRNS